MATPNTSQRRRTTASVLGLIADVAEHQDGFISAAQAGDAGLDRQSMHRLVSQGILNRDQRGIYRIARYPMSENGELWGALLSVNSRPADTYGAVLCYGTALSLYDISTINPSKIDIAIPRLARFRRETSPTISVRRRDYSPQDVATIHGLPATTLYRTLADLIVERSELQFVDEALDAAPKRGLLTSKELSNLANIRSIDAVTMSFLRM